MESKINDLLESIAISKRELCLNKGQSALFDYMLDQVVTRGREIEALGRHSWTNMFDVGEGVRFASEGAYVLVSIFKDMDGFEIKEIGIQDE